MTVEIDKLNYLTKSDPAIITHALARAIIFGCETKFTQLVEHIERQVGDHPWFLHHTQLTTQVLDTMRYYIQGLLRKRHLSYQS